MPLPKPYVLFEQDTMDKVQKHSDPRFIIYAILGVYEDTGILSGNLNGG
jgi:hypothetical protein